MAARFGYTKDLSLAEQRKMFAYGRKLRRGAAIDRAKRTTQSFVERNGPLIVAVTAAVVLLYFRKEVREKIGSAPYPQLTP